MKSVKSYSFTDGILLVGGFLKYISCILLVAYPPAKTDLYVMPDSVTNANILFDLEFPYTEIIEWE